MYVPLHEALNRIIIVRFINSLNVHKLLLATSPLGRGGSMPYFGKGPGFVEPWLSTKTGGGGGGGREVFEIQELRPRFTEVALRF